MIGSEIVAATSLDTGTVVAQVDAAHLTVDLGDRQVTVLVPGAHAGAVPAGAFVLVAQTARTTVLIDVITGAWNWRADVGTRAWYDGATAPTGWLIEDGSSFSGTTYPALQVLLGGTTLRDMRDRTWVGKSGTKALNSTGGAASVTLTAAELPAHTHTVSNIGIGTVQNGDGANASVYYPSGANSDVSSTGSGASFSVQNPFRAANSIIKAA